MKTKPKQPKRIKRWVNVYTAELVCSHRAAQDARSNATLDVVRVAVPLIELRRGEVVVDVEALVEAFDKDYWRSCRDLHEILRAAIKRVGVR